MDREPTAFFDKNGRRIYIGDTLVYIAGWNVAVATVTGEEWVGNDELRLYHKPEGWNDDNGSPWFDEDDTELFVRSFSERPEHPGRWKWVLILEFWWWWIRTRIGLG